MSRVWLSGYAASSIFLMYTRYRSHLLLLLLLLPAVVAAAVLLPQSWKLA